MNKNNSIIYKFQKISKSLLFFIFLLCLINFQKSLSFFSLFETATPSLISIILYLCIKRLRINPSNLILFFLGLIHDIMIGDDLGFTSIYLLLFKYFSVSTIFDKIINNNKEEWISFTIIFIFSFGIIFVLNILINLSLPDLSPIFFHVGITLILFPIINIGINFFSFVMQLIKS